jgi:hypothetical protein
MLSLGTWLTSSGLPGSLSPRLMNTFWEPPLCQWLSCFRAWRWLQVRLRISLPPAPPLLCLPLPGLLCSSQLGDGYRWDSSHPQMKSQVWSVFYRTAGHVEEPGSGPCGKRMVSELRMAFGKMRLVSPDLCPRLAVHVGAFVHRLWTDLGVGSLLSGLVQHSPLGPEPLQAQRGVLSRGSCLLPLVCGVLASSFLSVPT